MLKSIFLSFSFLFLHQVVSAQLLNLHKKEQIEKLNSRVDSLFHVRDSLEAQLHKKDSMYQISIDEKMKLTTLVQEFESIQQSSTMAMQQRLNDTILTVKNQLFNFKAKYDSLLFLNSLIVDCEETSEEIPGKKFERLFKTCSFKNHRTMSIGEPDYKGRYSYKYKLYKLLNDSSSIITNAEFIKETRRDEFLAILNVRIADEAKKVYQMAQDEKSNCFDGFVFKAYTYEELGIQFNEDMVEFTVPFGLPNACMPYDGVLIAIPLKEMVAYFSE
jgi:hypothetical protein